MHRQTHPIEVYSVTFKVASRYELKTNTCTERDEKRRRCRGGRKVKSGKKGKLNKHTHDDVSPEAYMAVGKSRSEGSPCN